MTIDTAQATAAAGLDVIPYAGQRTTSNFEWSRQLQNAWPYVPPNEALAMPPPPVTPSPHRFVVKKEAAAARRTPLSQTQTHQHIRAVGTSSSSAQQFNATPRFAFSSTPQLEATQRPPGPPSSAARFSTPRPTAAYRAGQDSIQSSASEIPDDVQDSIEVEDGDLDVRSNFGVEEQEQGEEGEEKDEEEDGFRLEERTPKRRRLSTPMVLDGEDYAAGEASNRSPIPKPDRHDEDDDMADSSPLPVLSSPTATVPKRASKFILSTPLPPSAAYAIAHTFHQGHLPSQTQGQPFSRPPRFRPPNPEDTATNSFDPLPEQFSPHRKGQKYVPGGLASEVRNWLVNLESSIPVVTLAFQGSKKGRRGSWGASGGDEEWIFRIIVDEVVGGSGAGMVIVRGRQAHGFENSSVSDSKVDGGIGMMADRLGEVRIVLAGEGQGVGVRKGEKVEVGRVVGVKGPAWEVGIDGAIWGVGVEWKVLR